MQTDEQFVRTAWFWHKWNPSWIPAIPRNMLKRMILRRYHRAVLCEIYTGKKLSVYPDDVVQCEIALTGDWEGAIYRDVVPLVRPGGMVLDVGAHIGYSAVVFADAVGAHGKVFTFEPVPELAERARSNAALNGLGDRIEVVTSAIGDREGALTLYVAPTLNMGMSSVVKRSRMTFKLEARMTTMDQWCTSNSIGEVDLVKLDIEGAEVLALRGMNEGLKKKRYSALMIELHDTALNALGSSATEVVRVMENYGYIVQGWDPMKMRFTTDRAADSLYVLAVAPR